MITRIGMAPRRESMTAGEFERHWRTSHADAAAQIPGVRRYIQNHAVLEAGKLILPYPGFDACSELDFDSLRAMDEGFASETYLRAVQADERRFVDKTRFSLVVAEREIVVDGPDLEGVKLISLFRAHPVAGAPELRAELRAGHAAAVRATGPLRHELLWPVVEAHSGDRMPAAAEAVEMIWFPSVAAALRFLHSDAGWLLAGKAFGVERHLARPARVV